MNLNERLRDYVSRFQHLRRDGNPKDFREIAEDLNVPRADTIRSALLAGGWYEAVNRIERTAAVCNASGYRNRARIEPGKSVSPARV